MWVVSKFNKVGSDLVLEDYPIPDGRLEEFQALFGLDSDEPMLDSYPVTHREKSALERLSGREFDLDRFEYFLDQYRD